MIPWCVLHVCMSFWNLFFRYKTWNLGRPSPIKVQGEHQRQAREQLACHTFVLTRFWCDLWSISEQRHSNKESTDMLVDSINWSKWFSSTSKSQNKFLHTILLPIRTLMLKCYKTTSVWCKVYPLEKWPKYFTLYNIIFHHNRDKALRVFSLVEKRV